MIGDEIREAAELLRDAAYGLEHVAEGLQATDFGRPLTAREARAVRIAREINRGMGVVGGHR